MNSQQRNRYRARHHRQITRFERKYLPGMLKALNSEVKKSAELIKERGANAAIGTISLTIINEEIYPVLKDLWLEISLFFANQAYGEIERSAKQIAKTKAQANFGFNAKWTQEVQNYLNQYILDRAVLPVTIANKSRILQILQEWSLLGLSVDEMVSRIQDPANNFVAYIARRAIRTEALYASAFGKHLAQSESPYECSKEWISARDHRTRHGHLKADSQVVDENATFSVSVYTKKGLLIKTDQMLYPGDRITPDIDKRNLINCRCTHAVFPKRDKQGNLIMKK